MVYYQPNSEFVVFQNDSTPGMHLAIQNRAPLSKKFARGFLSAPTYLYTLLNNPKCRFSLIWKRNFEIFWISLTLITLIYYKNIKKMWKVGRTHFENVRPKGKQCALAGALFSKKCARRSFYAPFAKWRSPNASLHIHNHKRYSFKHSMHK